MSFTSIVKETNLVNLAVSNYTKLVLSKNNSSVPPSIMDAFNISLKNLFSTASKVFLVYSLYRCDFQCVFGRV